MQTLITTLLVIATITTLFLVTLNQIDNITTRDCDRGIKTACTALLNLNK